MPTSLVTSNSLLAIDVGAANTRAVLFDVIEGEYRFVASGTAPSTAEAPVKDASEGARNAIQSLQSILKKTLLDASGLGVKVQTGKGGSVASNTAGTIDPDVQMEGVAVINGEVFVD
ncbi:MAG: glutamate mutase L, partial [Anaerolineae bacterium]|nr:glutamate mutase L [Anaerolineae bacterium]